MFQQQQEVRMFKEADDSEYIEYQLIDVHGIPLSDRVATFKEVQTKAFDFLEKTKWTQRVFILVIDMEYGPIGDQEVLVS